MVCTSRKLFWSTVGTAALALSFLVLWQVTSGFEASTRLHWVNLQSVNLAAMGFCISLALLIFSRDRKWWYWVLLIGFPLSTVVEEILIPMTPGLFQDLGRNFDRSALLSVLCFALGGFGVGLVALWVEKRYRAKPSDPFPPLAG